MSDWREYKTLSLDGKTKSLQGWRAHAQQLLQEGYGLGELEDIMEFVVDWSNRKEWIETRTSGSTGRPKNIKIKKEDILSSALRTIEYLGLKAGHSTLLCMPNRFIGGKMMIARSIIGGFNLHIAESTSKPEIPDGVSINFAALVPLQLHNIVNDPASAKEWKKVDTIIVGGGKMDSSLEEKLKDWPNRIFESFGMTETVSHIGLRRVNGSDASAFFEVLPNIEIERDEENCLVIRSESIPKSPLTTKDIVEIEEGKMFKWIGRSDNMINSGGVKIIPEVLEKLVKPLINTSFFFAGVPDDQLGERVTLVMESQPLSEMDEDELMKDLRKELHKFEVPKEIHYVPAFEETESGKIHRKKTVKAMLAK